MQVPDYADPTPAYQQIAADLRARIRSGEYPLGGRLPSNKALVETYGVAEGTVRAALDELRGEGAVATQSTRGTYVTRKPRDGDAGAVVAELREDLHELARRVDGMAYDDLKAAVVRLEVNLMDLYAKAGFDYPHEDEPPASDTRAAADGNHAQR